MIRTTLQEQLAIQLAIVISKSAIKHRLNKNKDMTVPTSILPSSGQVFGTIACVPKANSLNWTAANHFTLTQN